MLRLSDVTISAPEAQVNNENESVIQKRNQRTEQECHTTYLSYYLS